MLLDLVKTSLDAEKQDPIVKKVSYLKNLSNTMGSLIKNIVKEIDSTREQMFSILESYAAVEIEKDAKGF